MSNYKYLSDEVVAKIDDDGKSRLSCSVDNEEFKKWLADGNTATAADAIPDPTYQENRVKEYPPIGDQLDEIYHNGIDAWKAKIKAVKDKYPKGNK
jgi:hypothetical protein